MSSYLLYLIHLIVIYTISFSNLNCINPELDNPCDLQSDSFLSTMLAKYALNDSTSHCGISLRLNGNPNSLPSSPKSLATMPAATHTLFKFEDERIKAWGFGSDGQLGYGNTNNIGDGVPPNLSIKDSDFIPIADSVKQLTAGSNFSCALLRTGDVKCWGNGALGKLGYNSILDVGDGIGQSILQAGDLVLE